MHAFAKLKTKNCYTFMRFAILLSGNIQVNSKPYSNSCNSCCKRVNKRYLCCIKGNVKIHTLFNNMRIFKLLFATNVKSLLSTETFQYYRKTCHFIREWIQKWLIQKHLLISKLSEKKHFQEMIRHGKCWKSECSL